MDPISMIVIAGVAAVSATSGYVAGRRRQQREDLRPAACDGCDHNFSFHDDGGMCMQQVERTLYGVAGGKLGMRWVRCGCQQYTGPIPTDRLLSTFTRDLPPLSTPQVPKPDGDAPEGR